MNSKKVQNFQQNFQHHGSLPHRDNDDAAEESIDASPKGSIPPRYCDGRGGIDLERVRLDQHEAQRQVIQAMIRRIQKFWSRR